MTNQQWQPDVAQRHALLTHVGFTTIRATQCWIWRTAAPVLLQRHHVVFRPLPDVGEVAFLDALEQVMDAALDQRTQADRATYGPAQAAKAFFALCASPSSTIRKPNTSLQRPRAPWRTII